MSTTSRGRVAARAVATAAAVAAATAGTAYGLLFHLGRTSGSTPEERHRPLPGDELVVERADAPRVLVLHSRTHLPPGWDDRFDAALDWVWTFSLEPVGTDRTRLLIRNRGTVRPWWLDAPTSSASCRPTTS